MTVFTDQHTSSSVSKQVTLLWNLQHCFWRQNNEQNSNIWIVSKLKIVICSRHWRLRTFFFYYWNCASEVHLTGQTVNHYFCTDVL